MLPSAAVHALPQTMSCLSAALPAGPQMLGHGAVPLGGRAPNAATPEMNASARRMAKKQWGGAAQQTIRGRVQEPGQELQIQLGYEYN